MTAAAFRGAYADFKLIKTRGVVSISFEVPVEQAESVLKVLGGMPVAASEVWCAVARLNSGAEAEPTLAPPTKAVDIPASAVHGPNKGFDSPDRSQPTPAGAKTKTAFRDMRPANQAGILCNEVPFQRFLSERLDWIHSGPDPLHEADRAADYIRNYCGVKTRSDIRPRTPSGDRWQKLFDEYQTWMHHPAECAA